MRKTKRFIFIQNTNNALIQTKKQISKREWWQLGNRIDLKKKKKKVIINLEV